METSVIMHGNEREMIKIIFIFFKSWLGFTKSEKLGRLEMKQFC